MIVIGLERLTKHTVPITLPEIYHHLPKEHWHLVRTMNQLAQAGVIGEVSCAHERLYVDEPQPYMTHIRFASSKEFGFSGNGRNMNNLAETVWPALGEAIERWSIRYVTPSHTRVATLSELTEPHLDLATISGPSFGVSTTHTLRTGDTIGCNDHTPLTWVTATTLPDHTPLLVPMQSVSRLAVQKTEPLIVTPISTGAATGQTHADALAGGLMEVIERDALMTHWLLAQAPRRLDLATVSDIEVQHLASIAKHYGLTLHTLYLKHELAVPVVVCVLLDEQGRSNLALSMSAAANLDPLSALTKALHDALASRSTTRRLVENLMKNATVNTAPESLTHQTRALYWADQARLSEIQFFLSGDSISWSDICANQTHHQLTFSTVLARLQARNRLVYYVDCANPTIASIINLPVVKVCIPHYQPLHLFEAYVAANTPRLHELRNRWKKPADFINQIPHPFL